MKKARLRPCTNDADGGIREHQTKCVRPDGASGIKARFNGSPFQPAVAHVSWRPTCQQMGSVDRVNWRVGSSSVHHPALVLSSLKGSVSSIVSLVS